ncbi:fumarylacetoacetate hydrolase family protein [Streptomyces sp. NPDC004539]|uniref:fumarylacetoacetate hydrolase family protein n=1 Tax=Streptomyces sp. NPDC004539 TaxID=3154280 RepID=UPI0033A1CB3F
MRTASVLIDGIRYAAVVEGDTVHVDTRPGGLDAVLAADGVLRPDTRAALSEVTFDAPLRPPVVFCVGQNYADHLAEKEQIHRPEPEFFLKAGQTVAAPGEPAPLDPLVTAKLDYETELGIVIGRAGRAIPENRAYDHVYGYVALNDLTARDRQVVVHPDGSRSMALGPGKNFDGSTRMGREVVTADEIGDPEDLLLVTAVDGEIRQRNTTRHLISSIPEIIAFVSRMLTLRPGAVIATGTPGGTGWGADPELGGTGATPPGLAAPSYLRVGQRVEGSIGPLLGYAFTVTAPGR